MCRLVCSAPACAARSWQGTTEAQRTLTDRGLRAHERVLVVTTDEDAAQVRVGLSRPGVSVIDLRAHAVTGVAEAPWAVPR